MVKQTIQDHATSQVKPHLENYEMGQKTFSWDTAATELVTMFDDEQLNIAYNCVDQHAASKKRDKTALIFVRADHHAEYYSYGDLAKLTNKFANVLTKHAVKKGDRVFVFLPTVPERYVAFLGTLKVGAVAGTMFAAFQEDALLDRLSDSGARVVVTNSELYPRIERICDKLPQLTTVIVTDLETTETTRAATASFPLRCHPDRSGGTPFVANMAGSFDFAQDDSRKRHGGRSYITLSYPQEMASASEEFDCVPMKKDDYAYMLYTSGTTGKPKGIVHAHYDILQAMVTTRDVLDLHDSDVYWCTADLGWVTGVVYGVLGVWGLGGTSVQYEGRFSPDDWYRVLQDQKVTIWYSAPTAIRMLMGAAVQPNAYDVSSLRHLASVGEPLNPEAISWGMEVFGLPFHDTWWQTELGAICITNLPCLEVKPGSMGKPLPGIQAAIIDDRGNELPDGEQGNLALKATTVSSLMQAVWGNQTKFRSYFTGDWYVSGDAAVRDSDGYFWFVGRTDDVINTAGERIGPFEVESALVEHPSVIEAGVIGKPDEVRGEIIKAFVVLKEGVASDEATKQTLQQHVKHHLSGHAYPREISFIERLPKTRSGKIMRRVLKAQELGQPVGDTSTLENY